MSIIAPPPIYLTILRRGDINIVDLAEVGSVIPRSETQVDEAFLRELVSEVMGVASSGYGRGEMQGGVGSSAVHEPDAVVRDLQRIGELIFFHLLTEPARQRLRAAAPCELYLRLDEQLIHLPWELCYDGEQFMATKFRVGRQVITGSPIRKAGLEREEKGPLRILLIADPTESLPQAGEETERLCSLLGRLADVEVTLLGGSAARKVPLLAALQTHQVVHFAGHSYYDPQTPSKSGWVLHEGVLTAGELSKLGYPPLLVFSNSCQAGATAEWTGGYRYEGQTFGIGSAFLLAGVKNYLGPFWVTPDEESVLFATAFYQRLVAGQSLGETLLGARQEVIRQRGWQGLTWAGYVLYGDPLFTLLPTQQELHTTPTLPVGKTMQGVQPSASSTTLERVETRRPETRTRLSRLWSIRRLLFIGGIAVAMFATLHFFPLWRSLPPSPLLKKGGTEKHRPKAIGVMAFKALSVDPHLGWMQEAIRDHFNSQLNKGADLQVYSKEHLDFLVQKGAATEIEVANQLGIAKMISGSFLVVADKLRIEAHIVNVENGMFEESDSIEGPVGNFFDLQRQLALKVMAHLHIPLSLEEGGEKSDTPTIPSLKAYKMLLEAEGETGGTGPAKQSDPDSEDDPQKKEEKLSLVFPVEREANVAWAQELPSRPTNRIVPEEEIRQVLESYRQAYENKDLQLLDALYLTLTPTQREANLRYFQNTQDLKVTIRDMDIDVRGDEAAVSYTREDRFVDIETGQNIKLETRLTKIFSRTEDGWKLVAGKQGTPSATPK